MKEEVIADIFSLIEQAEKNPRLSKRFIKSAKKIAMRNTIKMPKELKKKYCSKCYSLFNSKNSETRIKNGFKTIKCLECENIKKIKIC